MDDDQWKLHTLSLTHEAMDILFPAGTAKICALELQNPEGTLAHSPILQHSLTTFFVLNSNFFF